MPTSTPGGAPESVRPLPSSARSSPRGRRRRAFVLAGILALLVPASAAGPVGAGGRMARTVWTDLGAAYRGLR